MTKPKDITIKRQSGVIPFLRDGKKLKVMLITPKQMDDIWIFPKGKLEPHLSVAHSAELEAFEEAGVMGKIISGQPVGNYTYSKYENTYKVDLFLFEIDKVLDDWQESHIRKRTLASLKKADKLLSDKSLRKILKKAAKYLKNK